MSESEEHKPSGQDVIRQAEQRRKELLARLSTAPTAMVAGVVHPSGVGGSKSPGDEQWTLGFELQPWRVYGGGTNEGKLSIHKLVSDQELYEIRDSMGPYDIIELQVRILDADASSLGEAHALLLGKPRKGIQDSWLETRAAELQQPVVIADEILGNLTLNRALNWYEAKAQWCAAPAHLCLRMDKDTDQAALISSARSIWRDQDDWDRRIRDYAAQELLALKNESWREAGEPEVLSEEFKSLMTLESLILSPDGRFEFGFDDGDLFWGHLIEVKGSLADGPTRADISG